MLDKEDRRKLALLAAKSAKRRPSNLEAYRRPIAEGTQGINAQVSKVLEPQTDPVNVTNEEEIKK